MRAFLAVPSDPAWAESGRRLVEKLKPSCPRASWTRPESWHLTIRFLGDVSESDAATFQSALERNGVAAVPAGELRSAGSVAFPSKGRPRVLGLGLSASASLEALWQAGDAAARAIGLPSERRPFHPHLTLARIRDPWPAEAVESFCAGVEGFPFPAWRFSSCVLFSSRLDPAGAVHTPVRAWELSGAGQEVKA